MAAQLLQIAGFAASVFVGLIFLVAGIDKLRHRALLPGVVANYRLLPSAFVQPFALALPVVELVVGSALLVGSRPLAPLAAIGLLLLFAGAMAINIGRGRRHIDCGCGQSALRQDLGWGMVARNVLFATALSVRLAVPGAMATYDLAIAVAAGATLYLLMLMYNAVRALPGRPVGAKG